MLSGRLNAIRLRSGAQPEKAIWQQTISIFQEILWNQAIPNIQPQLTMLAGRQQKSLCLKTNFSRDAPLASVFLPELDYLRLVIMPLNGAIKLLRWLFCSLHKHSASRPNWVWHIFKFFGALSFFHPLRHSARPPFINFSFRCSSRLSFGYKRPPLVSRRQACSPIILIKFSFPLYRLLTG